MLIATAMRNTVVLLLLFFSIIGTVKVFAQPTPPAVKTFSLSCRSAILRDVLAQLAIQKSINIAGLDSIDKGLTVTAHLNAVPFEAGLHALLGPKGFTFEKRGDIYFIVKPPPAHTRLSLNISDSNLSIEASGTDVNVVIGALAKAGISITSATSLTGTITAHLTEQPIDKALPMLFADFMLHQADGIYRITEHPSPIAGGSSTLLIHGGLISLRARDTALTDLLAELAEQLNINLSVIGEIDQQVTVLIEDKPLNGLLYSLAQMTGYSYHTVEDLHFFGKASLTPDETNPLLQRKTIWLNHLKAKEVLNLLPADIPKQHVTVSETHNSVTVVGSGELIASTEQFLSSMDIDSDAIRSRQPKGTIAIAQARETFRLTVDLKNAPLFDVIRQLSIETGVDVVFLDAEEAAIEPKPDTLTGGASIAPESAEVHSVTLRLSSTTLERVLEAVFLGADYTYKWADPPTSEERPMLIVGSGGRDPFTKQELIALSYLDVVAVLEQLPQPIDVQITPLPSRNALLVTGSQGKVDLYKASIEAIDVPQPQAWIQLYLLELTHGNRDELGLTIAGAENRNSVTLDDGITLNFDTLKRVPQTFVANLSALVKENRGKVLANPSLAVVNGQKASIDIGGKHLFETNNPIYPTIGGTFNPGQEGSAGIMTFPSYPPSTYRSHFTIETGLMLELTPSIGASGEVVMDIQLAIRDADQLSREASSLSQRLINTTVSVPDNGMAVIGGLLQEKEKKEVSRLPLLWRMPLLGKFLFTSTETTLEQTELVVIIQPKVLVR